jgi:DNA invertase Pin-like site-specific DNA recombinase
MSIQHGNDSLQPPISARNGRTVMVLGIARISTVHQNLLSLEDQEALYRRWLDQRLRQPYNLRMIAGRGSGENLDREEARLARAEVETARYDLVIAEDLGRIFRRVHAQLFCELCEDYDTRLIAINDQVDTAQENWRVLAGFANMRHEMYNADTAKRIRRSHRARFMQGGIVQFCVYGYLKPDGIKSDADLRKDPAAEEVYAEIFRLLENGAAYSEVADWLNEKGIAPGRYARSERWTHSMVSKLIHNPIIKGVRVRNRKMSRRVNQTGHRKSVNAPPSERLERICPHLAFIEPARYDRLVALLDERNARFRRAEVDGVDPRKNVPRKRTVWPGQHIDCGICGRPYVYGGNGQSDHLMCRGATEYRCWNAASVDGPLAAREMIAAIRDKIETLPDFDPQLTEMVQEEMRRSQHDKGSQQRELAHKLAAVEREIQNLMRAFRAAGDSPSLLEELRHAENQKNQITWDMQELAKLSDEPPVVPSAAEVRRLAAKAFGTLSVTSQEFGRLLRRLTSRITVHPHRLCDCAKTVLRARFTLDLASLLPAANLGGLAGVLRRSLVVDLFEAPQREVYREPVLELTANGLQQRDIAYELGITQAAVQRAVALGRQMQTLQISDPYLLLTAPPDDDRLCRHRHPRYRFEPLVPPQVPPPSA